MSRIFSHQVKFSQSVGKEKSSESLATYRIKTIHCHFESLMVSFDHLLYYWERIWLYIILDIGVKG